MNWPTELFDVNWLTSLQAVALSADKRLHQYSPIDSLHLGLETRHLRDALNDEYIR